MWTLKLEVASDSGLFAPPANKHNVRVYLNPTSQTIVNGSLNIHICGTVEGENYRAFLDDLGKDPRIAKLEVHDNFFLSLVTGFEEYQAFFNPEIMHFEPWTVDGLGQKHVLHLGSWDRKHLSKILEMLEPTGRAKILRFENRTITNFFLTSMRPQLTAKQRIALELAIQNGYYDYPRKMNLKDLASQAGLSFATFQAHLRKAERKVLPFSLSLQE